jgi:hypothetical protein
VSKSHGGEGKQHFFLILFVLTLGGVQGVIVVHTFLNFFFAILGFRPTTTPTPLEVSYLLLWTLGKGCCIFFVRPLKFVSAESLVHPDRYIVPQSDPSKKIEGGGKAIFYLWFWLN